jgi:hypothetical protein
MFPVSVRWFAETRTSWRVVRRRPVRHRGEPTARSRIRSVRSSSQVTRFRRRVPELDRPRVHVVVLLSRVHEEPSGRTITSELQQSTTHAEAANERALVSAESDQSCTSESSSSLCTRLHRRSSRDDGSALAVAICNSARGSTRLPGAQRSRAVWLTKQAPGNGSPLLG